MYKRYLVLAVQVFLLFFVAAVGTTVNAQMPNLCGSHPCIQVGTFNIEWLGTSDTSLHEHRSKKAVQQIANLISETVDLEVVVLEEVNAQSDEFSWLKTALEKKGYKLIAGTSGKQQNVIIAYDTDEVSGTDIEELDVRSSFDLPNNCRSSGLRRPLVGHFKAGNFDFILIGVHLKAQPGGTCSDNVREAQTMDIRDKIPELISDAGESDVIITGDFNAPLEDASLNPLLQDAGLIALTQSNRRANGSNNFSYIKKPFTGVIDHLLIKAANTDEWINKSTFIFNPPTDKKLLENYLRFTSDHVPTWSSFRTDVGND